MSKEPTATLPQSSPTTAKMADKIGKKKIIINADDFGYSAERNKGIVESFVRGVVSSVSLLVNGSSALEAIALAKGNMMPLGLHVNLTEGRPLRKGHNTLTDESGFLRGKMGFREALRNGQINEAEVNNRHRMVGRSATKLFHLKLVNSR